MTDKLTKQLFLLLAAGLPLASYASPPETGPQPIPLYGENTPAESNGMSREGVTLTADILTGAADADYFLLKPDPDKTSGMAVVICPGGGYGCTCYGYEGLGPAEWLREQGILAVVLRYRVPNGHGSIPLADAEQALRTVRSHAAEWGVNPSRIGVMGFSAGGHLAATASTLFTGLSRRTRSPADRASADPAGNTAHRSRYATRFYNPVLPGHHDGSPMDTRRFPKKPARSESLRIGNRTVQRGKAGNGRNAAGLYRSEQRGQIGLAGKQRSLLRSIAQTPYTCRIAHISGRPARFRVENGFSLPRRNGCVAGPLAARNQCRKI